MRTTTRRSHALALLLLALPTACVDDAPGDQRRADGLLPPVNVPAPALLTSRDSSRIPPGTQLALDSAASMTPPFTQGHAPRPSTSSAATSSPVPVPYKPSGPPTIPMRGAQTTTSPQDTSMQKAPVRDSSARARRP